MNYVALILSGGEGTRLKPLTDQTPKPVIPLLNKPFLFYQLDLIDEAGIGNCFLLSGYKADILKKTFKNKYKNLKVEIIEEEKPMGTGGAIGFAKEIIKKPAIVFNGDVLFQINLKEIIKKHKEKRAEGTIMAINVKDPSRFGVITMQKDGRIKEFLEKIPDPPSKWINGGLYIFEWNILRKIPKKPCSIERDVFPKLLKEGNYLWCYKYRGYWKDIGTIESYREATFDLVLGKLVKWKKEVENNRLLSKNKNVKIDKFSVVGKNCKTGKNTKIIKSIIFDNCKIGKNCLIKNSIVSYNIKIKENSNIDGEVLVEN